MPVAYLKIRVQAVGLLIVFFGFLTIFDEWFLTGSLQLSDFNPLSGFHHEWLGAALIVTGAWLASPRWVRFNYLYTLVFVVGTYLLIVAVAYVLGVR